MVHIENLSVSFEDTEAVKNVNLHIAPGEILGVVGESGSGKSVTALTLMGLVSDEAVITSGRIVLDGATLVEAGKPRDKALYRAYQGSRMSMIFQEPMTSLNPTKTVGKQIEEMLKLHTRLDLEARRKRVVETMESVGLKNPGKLYGCYPHELSGGMRQRVMIAMAVILHPDVIVADEPTTALDVTIQNQIMTLLKEINEKEKNAMLFITHDLNLARRICDRIVVMKNGQVVESGTTEEIFERPKQEYTQMLIEAVPSRLKPKADIAGGKDAEDSEPVVSVANLNVYYKESTGGLLGRKYDRCVVEDANFVIGKGEIVGLVGESGCGKSSLSKAVLGMNKNIKGSVDHTSVRPQMIFQDPYSSLNPSRTVSWLLQEPLRAAAKLDPALQMTKEQMENAALEMLRKVGLDESYMNRKPSQLSGGQRQRISIGQALITRPQLVIADEPVSALDVTLQAQIMELMRSLQQELGVSYLFISHDINVVYQMCDRIMVMKDGKIIEQGKTEDIFNHPKESYTELLLRES